MTLSFSLGEIERKDLEASPFKKNIALFIIIIIVLFGCNAGMKQTQDNWFRHARHTFFLSSIYYYYYYVFNTAFLCVIAPVVLYLTL